MHSSKHHFENNDRENRLSRWGILPFSILWPSWYISDNLFREGIFLQPLRFKGTAVLKGTSLHSPKGCFGMNHTCKKKNNWFSLKNEGRHRTGHWIKYLRTLEQKRWIGLKPRTQIVFSSFFLWLNFVYVNRQPMIMEKNSHPPTQFWINANIFVLRAHLSLGELPFPN